jgi:2-polyprenyl-3-methyl-5-hydroxy-6-metoxy-1,4-benzoquinol methylase
MKVFFKKILFVPSIAKKITKLLVRIHQFSYRYLGVFASASESGLHPKHRLICYHKFFVENVSKGDRVLDIGCGNGVLLKDIAVKTDAPAIGVEITKENAELAKNALSDLQNVQIIQSDILEFDSNIHCDVIILSNVIEHINNRVELLKNLTSHFKPKKILIRVPMFEREWLVPFKKELGIEWRLDPTHHIEYTESEFRDEMSAAGLELESIIFKWGEIYTVTTPLKRKE